jgi:hypothetical protein
MARGENVCNYTNGKGYWLRREWKPQCSAKVFFDGRCQGVKAHKGVHWRYGPSGDFEWDDNDDDPQEGGGAGSTPPAHKDYVSPVKMQKHHHMSHYTDTEVTDKAIIAILEKGKPPEPDAAIHRPVTDKRLLAALRKRLNKERTPKRKPDKSARSR